MRKIWLIATALLVAGCAQEIVDESAQKEWKTLHEVVYAAIDREQTKTSIDTERNPMIRWSEGDEISVFASSVNEQYRFNGTEGDGFATFEHISGSTGSAVGTRAYAVYPYHPDNKSDNGLVAHFPEQQAYAEDSFGKGAAPMVAMCQASTNLHFAFQPICGYLKLALWNPDGKRVKSVRITAPNAKIAGAASVLFAVYGRFIFPQVTMDESATNSVTLVCENGVALGTSAAEATVFWITLPPVTMAEGFTVTVTGTDGSTFEKTTTRSRTITRNVINEMEALECEFVADLSGYVDLSAEDQANSYIVSEAGQYKFKTVKGNSNDAVGNVDSAEVLWESYGTDQAPAVGDLVCDAICADGYIGFTASDKKGNAVIAAKDAEGNILWSWHIWMTDKPVDQMFARAGILMDRNLGATSATKDDVKSYGLLYQWGRKDPFMGADGLGSSTKAASTITWPANVGSNYGNGSVSYSIAHPTTFISPATDNKDWVFTSVNYPDDSRWTADKTKYDPCPAGYRVPEVTTWAKAFGISSEWKAGDYEDDPDVWFPKTGQLRYHALQYVGGQGNYWSCTPWMWNAYVMYHSSGYSYANHERAYACSVRCFKEGSDVLASATDLSAEGTANSYIVSEEGIYKFKTVKGNSAESVGTVASVEVLWESFGTDQAPSVGDLVSGASYTDGYILFTASDKKGNAVIAAKDAEGNILWSWHIWMTDKPADQRHKNNAGIFMDRNLGATSATKDDAKSYGLLYQWGRKDPFMGPDGLDSSTKAASTITWPANVGSNSHGEVSYSIAHPTTFISPVTDNKDWVFTSVNYPDNSRWTADKTKYDPCPAGYRVPEVTTWAKAFGISSEWKSGDYEDDPDVWFPKAGQLRYHALQYVGVQGNYWSCTPWMWNAYAMCHGSGYSYANHERAYACSVRCFKEGSDEIVNATDLSIDGTATHILYLRREYTSSRR